MSQHEDGKESSNYLIEGSKLNQKGLYDKIKIKGKTEWAKLIYDSNNHEVCDNLHLMLDNAVMMWHLDDKQPYVEIPKDKLKLFLDL